MRVILLEKVARLGSFGEKVNVKAGYARNYLVPQGKAVPATKKNVEYLSTRNAELEAKISVVMYIAEASADKINKLGSVTITSKAVDAGKLFGSIGSSDIANAISAAGVHVSKSEVRMPNGVLRTTGVHEVIIQVHREVCTTLNVVVVGEA